HVPGAARGGARPRGLPVVPRPQGHHQRRGRRAAHRRSGARGGRPAAVVVRHRAHLRPGTGHRPADPGVPRNRLQLQAVRHRGRDPPGAAGSCRRTAGPPARGGGALRRTARGRRTPHGAVRARGPHPRLAVLPGDAGPGRGPCRGGRRPARARHRLRARHLGQPPPAGLRGEAVVPGLGGVVPAAARDTDARRTHGEPGRTGRGSPARRTPSRGAGTEGDRMNSNGQPTSDRIMRLITGYWATGILGAAATHSVFTHLAAGAADAVELAARAGISVRGAQALLDGLVSVGLVEVDAGGYRNSDDAAAFLVEGQPTCLTGFAKVKLGHMLTLADLPEVVRVGGPLAAPVVEVAGNPHWEGLIQALAAQSAPVAEIAADALRLAEAGEISILDIGGGSG